VTRQRLGRPAPDLGTQLLDLNPGLIGFFRRHRPACHVPLDASRDLVELVEHEFGVGDVGVLRDVEDRLGQGAAGLHRV